jgi:hypothetical protein
MHMPERHASATEYVVSRSSNDSHPRNHAGGRAAVGDGRCCWRVIAAQDAKRSRRRSDDDPARSHQPHAVTPQVVEN